MQQSIRSVMIIGGGLGGLVLAQALKNRNINFTIFERDTSAVARDQGYHIGLNDDGATALTELQHPELQGLLEEQKTTGFSVVTSHLRSVAQIPTAFTKEYESKTSVRPGLVDRIRLREFLTHGIEDHITWDKKFVKYEETPDKVTAYFEDGTTAEADLLVAADGANSRIRTQRCPELVWAPVDCSTSMATIPMNKEDFPTIHKYTQDNMLRVLGPMGHAMLIYEYKKLNGEEWILWSMSHPSEEEVIKKLSEEEHKQHYVNKSKMFHPEIQLLVERSPKILLNYEYKSIVPLKHNPLKQTTRVTLLGDAAHATTSHRGLGANTAFKDAIDLANAIQKDGDWKVNVGGYEEVMMKRGCDAIKQSTMSTDMMHSTNFGKRTMKYVVFYLMGAFISLSRVFSK
jgi:salicylate hydroxylase